MPADASITRLDSMICLARLERSAQMAKKSRKKKARKKSAANHGKRPNAS
jgi:hypothetical protein